MQTKVIIYITKMSYYKDLVEAGNNFRPAPWQVAKTICYWADSDKSPDIPISGMDAVTQEY